MSTPSTRDKLITSAIDLFSSTWYAAVSVANICRQAGVSNGIFYKYFQDKEGMLKTILEMIIEEITTVLTSCGGDSLHERIEGLVNGLVGYAAKNPNLIRVYREGQYRFFEYEQRLSRAYETTLTRIFGSTVSHARYLYALGGMRFASIRSALYGVDISLPALIDIIEHGLFAGLDFDERRVFDIAIQPPPISLQESTEKRLLAAGKRLFGERGFHAVNIHDITDAAGFSVGAFYKYFVSKESYFERLIEEAGHEVRRFIASNLSKGLNRLEQEMQGMFLFAAFLSVDKWCYKIVREGEFIAPRKARDYYEAFAAGYRKTIGVHLDPERRASIAGYETTAIEFLLGISHYFGIEMVFDQSHHNAKQRVKELGHCMIHGLNA